MKTIITCALTACLSVSVGTVAAQQKKVDDPLQYRVLEGYLNKHPRGRIAIPDILGYKTIKADLHLHTMQSDGQVTPSFRVQEAYEEGLDAIAITDHQPTPRYNNISDGNFSYEQALKTAKKFKITLIRGAEVTGYYKGNVGHMNFLFTTDNNRYYPRHDDNVEPATADSLLRQAQADGVWVTTNHPGWPDHDSELSDFLIQQIKAGRIHGVEVFNDQEFYPRAIDYLYDYNLTPIGATDCHLPIAYRFNLKRAFRAMTLIFAKDGSEAAIKEAMFARRTIAYADNLLAGKQPYVEALLKASVKLSSPVVSKKSKTVTLRFTNVSAIPYTLREKTSGTTILVKPLDTTEVTCAPTEMESEWEVTNIYVRPTVHLSLPLSSLVAPAE